MVMPSAGVKVYPMHDNIEKPVPDAHEVNHHQEFKISLSFLKSVQELIYEHIIKDSQNIFVYFGKFDDAKLSCPPDQHPSFATPFISNR